MIDLINLSDMIYKAQGAIQSANVVNDMLNNEIVDDDSLSSDKYEVATGIIQEYILKADIALQEVQELIKSQRKDKVASA